VRWTLLPNRRAQRPPGHPRLHFNYSAVLGRL